MNEKTKEVQDRLAKNLGKMFEGMNGTGHKDFPKPLGGARDVPAPDIPPKPPKSSPLLPLSNRIAGQFFLG